MAIRSAACRRRLGYYTGDGALGLITTREKGEGLLSLVKGNRQNPYSTPTAGVIGAVSPVPVKAQRMCAPITRVPVGFHLKPVIPAATVLPSVSSTPSLMVSTPAIVGCGAAKRTSGRSS